MMLPRVLVELPRRFAIELSMLELLEFPYRLDNNSLLPDSVARLVSAAIVEAWLPMLLIDIIGPLRLLVSGVSVGIRTT